MSSLLDPHDRMLTIRRACAGDVFLLWKWVNDPIVRASAFQPAVIPFESHMLWFEAKLTSDDTRIWIMERDLIPVAQVRYEREKAGDVAVDVSVAATARGQGLATAALRMTLSLALEELGAERVIARIKPENAASRRAFARAGFYEEPLVESKVIVMRWSALS